MYSYSGYGNASGGWRECSVPSDELMHYGVSGMKKGQRRYQDEFGRYTAEGRQHYGIGVGKLGTGRLSKKIERVNTKYNNKIGVQKEALQQIRSAKKGAHDLHSKAYLNDAESLTRENISYLQAKQKRKADKYKARLIAKQQRVSDKYDAKINRQQDALNQYREVKKGQLSGREKDLIKQAEGMTREEIKRLKEKRSQKMSRF